jgi:pyridoxamine 5'-phosphate oxidase
MNPLHLFKDWYSAHLTETTVTIPAACCLSTIGLDGYPNARFVALKEVLDEKFVVTGPLNSRKGLEIDGCNKVALTFWWTEIGRQVRIQGDAAPIPPGLADSYFKDREYEAKIVSSVSSQGKPLEDVGSLNERYRQFDLDHADKNIERPANWGGYFITPVRMEFMSFSLTRFHERVMYELADGLWVQQVLQP